MKDSRITLQRVKRRGRHGSSPIWPLISFLITYDLRILAASVNYDASLDVTQEVFIKVYNSLTKYSPEYKFSTWLYRIAHNAAVDHMRRNSVTPQSLETENADGSYQIQIESRAASPEQDRERLTSMGIARVYTPKDYELGRIMRDIADVAVAHRAQ